MYRNIVSTVYPSSTEDPLQKSAIISLRASNGHFHLHWPPYHHRTIPNTAQHRLNPSVMGILLLSIHAMHLELLIKHRESETDEKALFQAFSIFSLIIAGEMSQFHVLFISSYSLVPGHICRSACKSVLCQPVKGTYSFCRQPGIARVRAVRKSRGAPRRGDFGSHRPKPPLLPAPTSLHLLQNTSGQHDAAQNASAVPTCAGC